MYLNFSISDLFRHPPWLWIVGAGMQAFQIRGHKAPIVLTNWGLFEGHNQSLSL